MARGKRAEALTKGTRYVAEQALNELFDGYLNRSMEGPDQSFGQWAVTRVWDVEHKPTAGRLVIVLDLNEPDEPVGPDQVGTVGVTVCPHISNGQQCQLLIRDGVPHTRPHEFD